MINGMTECAARVRLLHGELRQIRRRADIAATGATLHQFRGYIASAQTALQMVEDCRADENTAALELLLTLVQEALQDARALIVQARDPKRAA